MPEHRVSIPSSDIVLEGALDQPEGSGPFPVVVVCHPHPQYGGDMHNAVVMAVVSGLLDAGIAALRFNFRGVGRSTGRSEGGAGEPDDVRAALAFAAALDRVDPSRIGLAGYSFGALMAARAATPSVPALALVAPPLSRGSDLGAALTAYPHPLLLIAGDADQFCPAAALRDLETRLGANAAIQVVAGADHFWFGHEGRLAGSIGQFFGAALGVMPRNADTIA